MFNTIKMLKFDESLKILVSWRPPAGALKRTGRTYVSLGRRPIERGDTAAFHSLIYSRKRLFTMFDRFFAANKKMLASQHVGKLTQMSLRKQNIPKYSKNEKKMGWNLKSRRKLVFNVIKLILVAER